MINRHFPLILLSLIPAVFFRLRDINRDIVAQDEATSLIYFILPSFKSYSFYDYFMPNNHIFHSILARLSVQLFGNYEIAFRLPVLLSGILAVGFIYWWAYSISNSKEIAFISSSFLALSPIHIIYSQMARGYSLVILFSIISQLSLYKTLENYKMRWLLLFTLANILNVVTMPSSFYFVVSQFIAFAVVYFLFKSSSSKFNSETKQYTSTTLIKRLVYSIFFALLPISLFYFPILDQIHTQAGIEGNNLLGNILLHFFNDNLLLGLSPVMSLFFLYGCWVLFIKRNFWGIYLFLLFCLPFIISLIVGVIGHPRVYLFGLPFFILTFAIGLYKIANQVFKILLPKYESNFRLKKIAALFAILAFSIPATFFLERHYYPQYHTFKFKKLREYMKKINISNDLVFKPGGLTSDYYLYELINQNASGILYSNNVNNMYLIMPNRILGDYIYSFCGKNCKFLKKFEDRQLNEKYDFDRLEKGPDFKVYQLIPHNIRKIIDKDFLKSKWIQTKGGQEIGVINNPDLDQIEISRNMNSSLKDISFVYANSFHKLKMNGKGFIFIIYALSYPNISDKWVYEPLSASMLIKDKKNKTITEQPNRVMNRNVSGLNFYNNRLWYIIQKIVPLEKGDYELTFGFWVNPLENNFDQSQFTVNNFQAYVIEF